jgi:hypothetical protein
VGSARLCIGTNEFAHHCNTFDTSAAEMVSRGVV